MHRHLIATALLLTLGVARGLADEPAADKATRPARVLPGVEADGAVRLPNQWSIRPAGKQIELGDFPVNIALHPSGKWVAALHAGYGPHEIIIVDLDAKKQRIASRVVLAQTFYGLCFAPDGKTLYASGGEYELVHSFQFEDGLLSKHKELVVADLNKKFIVAGLAVDPKHRVLCAAGTWGHGVSIVPLDQPERFTTIPLGKESYPYGCLIDAAGKRLYVSLWSQAALAVIDLDKKEIVANFSTEPHPTEMIFSPDGKTLYVACSNSTRVSVLNAADGKGLETINCALHPNAPPGNTPSSLALTPDGQMFFVANSDANNVAVFNVAERGQAKPLGFIPTGIYPTAVRCGNDKRLYIANGRGTSTRANSQGPNPLLPANKTVREYIAGLYRGSLSVLDVPTPERAASYSKHAYLCSPLRADLGVTLKRPEGNPIPGKVGDRSPIKHCVYIIRENRTYDQVFGDVKGGNGDPNLCIFPEKVTPNAHRLARDYVLLDNFYCEGEVSADGHEWSMGAYATDFVKKVWPLSYRGSPTKKMSIYPSEGEHDLMERPAGGYIWDRCAAAKVSYRSYGEWVKNGKTPKDPATANVKALEGHFDPWFRSYDLDYPDVKRAERFMEELKRFEREGAMPSLIILRLPNDHTYGTRPGKLTPTALVADNDLALGMTIEALSKSKFWPETAVFVIEDDAQNGSDHVDAHRTVALVISPWTKRSFVDSTMYSTSSMLRTMELILGLRPMSQFDAAAHPMYHSFQAKADTRPYTHVVPEVDLKAKNLASAWGAKLSETFDFTKEDAADDLLLNEVVWRSVRGPNSPMPPPVRAAFVFPHVRGDDDDDDD